MDKAQQGVMALYGYAIAELPNLRTIPRMDFRHPDGRILSNLPADAYHLTRYLARGFKPIYPDSELQEGFVCEVCGKGFKHKIALAGHKRTHK